MIDARTTASSDLWETPLHVLNDVREVFGGYITFDPFCTTTNCTGISGAFHDHGMDGFTTPWLGNVYVNSPYGRLLPKVVAKIADAVHGTEECGAVIQLAPARFGSRWFIEAANNASRLLVLKKRPAFTLNGEPARDKKGNPATSQFDVALFYYGHSDGAKKFDEVFASKGTQWRIVK